MECSHCSKICKNLNSLKQHEIRCKSNINKIVVKSNLIDYNEKIRLGELSGTNQYIKAASEGRTVIVTKETKDKLSLAGKNRIWSEDKRLEISKRMQITVKKYPESYSSVNINGRVKQVEYNGSKLDGGWELIVAKWFDLNNIKWIRNTNGFNYDWNGPRTYFPDFYLIDLDLYVEVKGYTRDRDILKWEVVPNLIIIKKNEIDLIKTDKFKLL